MAGAVAGGRDQGDLVGEPRIAGNEFSLACIDDRLHRVIEDGDLVRRVAMVAPVLIFGPAEKVARPLKGWQPSVVDKAGVPADMVDVEMGAEHDIDALGWKAGLRHDVEIRTVALIPGRYAAALLVVAKPRIDHDAMLQCLHHQRMDRHFQPAFFGRKMRDQPRKLADFLVGCLRQDEPRRADGLQFHDLGDLDLAYLPLHRALPRIVAFSRQNAAIRLPAQWIIFGLAALWGRSTRMIWTRRG